MRVTKYKVGPRMKIVEIARGNDSTGVRGDMGSAIVRLECGHEFKAKYSQAYKLTQAHCVQCAIPPRRVSDLPPEEALHQ